jgi:hypothetical protein
MADSTPLIEQIESAQASKEVTANALFDAASVATAYGRHAEACAGRTWGYYGTRYGGQAVANGSHLCAASDTTYMVVDRVTGEVSFAASDTDWLDTAAYARAYLIVAGASTITSYEDHRFGPDGIFAAGGSGAGGGGGSGNLDGGRADSNYGGTTAIDGGGA